MLTLTSPDAPAATVKSERRRSRLGTVRARDDAKWFRILTFPWLAGFVLLSLLPLVVGLFISFTNYNGVNPAGAKFVGAANYVRAFEDPNVAQAAGRTLVFAVMYLPLSFVIALALALLVNAGPKVRGLFRSLYYLPAVVPLVGAAFIWRALFNRDSGLINGFLTSINPAWNIPWLDEFATPVLTSMSLWLSLGLSTVLYLAALQSVPIELEQAATVDGANYFQRLRHVIFPLISPVVFYQILIALIYALGVTMEPILLGSPSPQSVATSVPNDNVFLNVYTYQQMFANQRFGYASALLWLTTVGAVLITVVLFATKKRWVHSESGNI